MKINIIITGFLLLTSSLCLSQEVINYGEHLWGEYEFNSDMTFGEGGGPPDGRFDVMVLAFSNSSSVPFQLTHNYSLREEMQLVPYSEVGTIQDGPEENLYFVYFEGSDERQLLQFLEDENGYHLVIDEMEYFTKKKENQKDDATEETITKENDDNVAITVVIKDAYCSEVCYLTYETVYDGEKTALLDILVPEDLITTQGEINEKYIGKRANIITKSINYEGEEQPIVNELEILD